MTIRRFTAARFRCLSAVDVELGSGYNVIVGENASGKTSFLEALAYLGRGKSFRGAPPQALVQHGERDFVLFGRVSDGEREHSVGVQNGAGGFTARIDGETAAGAAALAQVLPLQVIDPDVHNLVQGGPEERRRFLDWVTFHVEPAYLETWRRFRRVLRQRNAALKTMPGSLSSWNAEFVELAEAVDAARQRTVARIGPIITTESRSLLDASTGIDYARGWPADSALAEALAQGVERDRQSGSTRAGPHRADLKLRYDERLAKRLVSRGQQKLLACSMILAATVAVQDALGKPVSLLLDDPAAELDAAALDRLLSACDALATQLVITSLDGKGLDRDSGRWFHVEQGEIRSADA